MRRLPNFNWKKPRGLRKYTSPQTDWEHSFHSARQLRWRRNPDPDPDPEMDFERRSFFFTSDPEPFHYLRLTANTARAVISLLRSADSRNDDRFPLVFSHTLAYLKMTDVEAAGWLDTKPPTIARWKNGKTLPAPIMRSHIFNALIAAVDLSSNPRFLKKRRLTLIKRSIAGTATKAEIAELNRLQQEALEVLKELSPSKIEHIAELERHLGYKKRNPYRMPQRRKHSERQMIAKLRRIPW